jgi:hypothetical protein
MKMLAVGAALVVCLGLSACAGTANNARLVHEPSMYDNVDYGKIVTVNQWALKRGATVVWINYPRVNAHGRPSDG